MKEQGNKYTWGELHPFKLVQIHRSAVREIVIDVSTEVPCEVLRACNHI